MTMSRLKVGLLSLFGAMLVIIPIVNAGTGLYAFNEEPMKYVWSEALRGGCTEEVINSGLSSGKGSRCVEPAGSFSSQDVVPMIIGIFIILRQIRKSVPVSGISTAGEGRKARLRMALGVSMFAVLVMDLFGQLDPSGERVDWAGVTAIPLPDAFFHAAFLLLGLQMFFKGRSALEENPGDMDMRGAVSSTEMRKQELLFHSSEMANLPDKLDEKGLSKYQTVGEMRQAMGISKHESEFEKAMSDDLGFSVGKTCHFCNGAGCAQCEDSGEL